MRTRSLLLALALPALLGCAPASRDADRRALLALHERVMEAHRRNDPGPLLEDAAEDFVQAGRGEITRPTRAERRARFERYLGSTRFSEYRDLVPPVVEVSDDGTLGWVVVQVAAEGLQRLDGAPAETVRFTSAWIELYRKRRGSWSSVGNVSSFKP